MAIYTDLKTFKEKIKQKLNESSFENKELYAKWEKIREEQAALQDLYKPRNKLTFHGFIKVCPNCGRKLNSSIIARKWGVFGLWEYTIFSCIGHGFEGCGYEYAESKNVRSG